MSIGKLTSRTAVLAAIAEYKAGSGSFLKKYGRGQAREYYLKFDGEMLPSKAILAGAYFHEHGDYIGNFSGGAGVGRQLEKLGFEIVRRQANNEILATAEMKTYGLARPPFAIGQEYSRKIDIHEIYGGQRQGGICTPAKYPFVFIFTGDAGVQYGYRDGWLDDEKTFLYTGEGQRGDMAFKGGNVAIRDHAINGKEILLFQTLGKGMPVRFLGYLNCASWEYNEGTDIDGTLRQVIQFQLVRDGSEASGELVDDEFEQPGSLDELRGAAYKAGVAPRNNEGPKTASRLYRQRSAAVKAYVLARAGGLCELTGEPAPFNTKSGKPYLEVHHTSMLSDNGPDHPRWVGAISPNVHREIHYGENGGELNRELKNKIAISENEFEPMAIGGALSD